MIIIKNQDRGIHCNNTSFIEINNSDIYENGYGIENQNTSSYVQAQGNWWGHTTGPYQVTTNTSGLGNAISDYVDYENWRDRSIDNPWSVFPSPTTSGQYFDVTAINLNGDDFVDIVGATNNNGLKFFQRTGFESWEEITSPLSTGNFMTLLSRDINYDGSTDIIAGGSQGVKSLIKTGTSWSVENILTSAIVFDIELAYIDDDSFYDLVVACGNNSGLKVFYGQDSGWTEGTKPDSTTTFRSVKVADFNQDGLPDIISTNIENAGLQIWYNDGFGGWVQQDPLDLGYAFYGMDIADIDFNGYPDIVASGNTPGGGIVSYLNQGDGSYLQSYSPTSFGIYNDISLTDMNGDSNFDMAASNQGSGIQTWLGNPNLYWNYWYHPIETSQFKRIEVVDMTLDNTPDVVAASYGDGIKIWSNRTPYGNVNPVFSTSDNELDFSQVLVNYSRSLSISIENVSSDTLINVVLYTTNPIFQVSENSGRTRDIGPFSLLPGEVKDVFVTYSPTAASIENEGIVIHSIPEVLLIPLIGEGVEEGIPEWTVDLSIHNAVGGINNNQILIFGTGIGATDSLDFVYNEVNLPPVPPTNIFDSRFQINDYEGFLRDIRNYDEQEHAYIIQWQAGDGGYPITLSWDSSLIPDNSFVISDLLGGVFVDSISMAEQDSLIILATMSASPYLKIEYNEISYTDFSFNLNQGWNLMSLPLEPAYEINELDSLFNNTISAFWYNPITPGYQQENILDVGKGYWMEMPSSTNRTLTGDEINDLSLNLTEGWNLVGTLYDPVTVLDLDTTPVGSFISAFGFNGSYFTATALEPGNGYWIEVNQDCTLNMNNGLRENENIEKNNVTQNITNDRNDGYFIPITVNYNSEIVDYSDTVNNQKERYKAKRSDSENEYDGRNVELEFGVHFDASDSLDIELGEINLPPLPPSNIFDVRFLLPDYQSTILDLKCFDGEEKSYLLSMQAINDYYPLSFQWDTEGFPIDSELLISDNMGGIFISPINMNEINELIIPDSLCFINELLITAFFPSVDSDDPILTYPIVSNLGQNFPNPFNPETTIKYSLKEDTNVKIEIFNIKGQKVKILIDEPLNAGYHDVVWNGKDNTDKQVSSGVYFYKMVTNDYNKVRRMVVIK